MPIPRSDSQEIEANIENLEIQSGNVLVDSGFGVITEALVIPKSGVTVSQDLIRALKRPMVIKHVRNWAEANPEVNQSAEANRNNELLTQHGLSKDVTSYESGILKSSKDGLMLKADAILGDILNKLRYVQSAHNGLFHQYFTVRFLECMYRSLTTLNQNERVHNDITPNNTWIRFAEEYHDHLSPGDIYFGLLDFGCSQNFNALTTEKGTYGIRAPEKICGQLPSDPIKWDIYSVFRVVASLYKKIPLGLEAICLTTEKFESAKPKSPNEIQQRLHRICHIDTPLIEKLNLTLAAGSEYLPENRLSLQQLFVIINVLREALPPLSHEDKKSLFEWYQALLVPVPDQTPVPPTVSSCGIFAQQKPPTRRPVGLPSIMAHPRSGRASQLASPTISSTATPNTAHSTRTNSSLSSPLLPGVFPPKQKETAQAAAVTPKKGASFSLT